MWAEYKRNKNNFLQKQLKHLTPQKINEMLNEEVIKTQNFRDNCNKLSHLEDNCKSFDHYAELAYGFWALPKLMKEMNSDDSVIQSKALNSFSEYIVNPLFAERAITQFNVVRRCQNIFLRIRLKNGQVRDRETTCFLVIFHNIVKYRSGAEKILQCNRLLDEFYAIICTREIHLEATSKILPWLSDSNEKCLQLINDYKVFDKLKDIWKTDPYISFYPVDLWLHLSHILEQEPREAVKEGFFEILYNRIHGHVFQYHIWDMKCFALLLRCQEGQHRFVQMDGIKLLYRALNDEMLDTHENVVFALMHGLFAKSSLWRCREFTNFPLILTKLARDSVKCEQQLFCLQALREMGVMPVIKRFMKENCYDHLRQLKCETINNERERNEIVHWLEREIYHTSDLRKKCLNLKEI